jgi:UDP-sugar transporter A1/2/3
MVLIQEGRSGVYDSLFANKRDTLLMGVPAGLYAFQNNLLFVALSNLDSSIFQVIYQLKVLTTALFSVLLLNRKLDGMKWIALVMLFFGVLLVQLQISEQEASGSKHSADSNALVGLIAVLASCITSGFAGVFFEKVLKQSQASIWTRNIQLSLFGSLTSFVVMITNDYSGIETNGFFFGYTPLVWVVIFNQALGGLVVAAVVKYADSIVKGFAMSLSIILGCIASMWLFDFRPTIQFFFGSIIVIFAVWLYGADMRLPCSTSARVPI